MIILNSNRYNPTDVFNFAILSDGFYHLVDVILYLDIFIWFRISSVCVFLSPLFYFLLLLAG
jgi:hypothetical protein